MTQLNTLVDTLTPEQRQALASLLLQSTPTTPTPVSQDPEDQDTPSPSSYYNMDEAVPVTFKADLQLNEKSRDKTYAQRFDHVWCKGNQFVKGPKGGVYFVGRCVLGVKKGQQIKGILRVGAKHFTALQQGGQMDAWFRPDGEADATLIGTLTNFRVV